MITFGNESLQNSKNNSIKEQVIKKPDDFELLKKKYKKLEKENKMLKATLEELINLSENLKMSFKNTESMYITISDSIKNVLSGKLYNSSLVNSSENLIKSKILSSQENLHNLNQPSSLNFLENGKLDEMQKNSINNNSSLNINSSVNLPININMHSNTNITNIYNNRSSNEKLNDKLNNMNEIIKINNKNADGSDLENINKENLIHDKSFQGDIISEIIERNCKDKNVVLTLGDEDSNPNNNLENNNKRKENYNALNLVVESDRDENLKISSENQTKNLNNLNASNDLNTASKENVHDKKYEKEFSEKIDNSLLNDNISSNLDHNIKGPKEDKIDIRINNNINANTNNNTNENSTNKDSDKNSNASQNIKLLENKENKNFGSEINLDIEFENITKFILDHQNKKEDISDDFSNKLAESFSELHKKFLHLKFEKEEYEKINIEILKILKQTEENYQNVIAKHDELNKYIDILYKSIHSILVLSDNSNEKTHTIKCEPVPSYLRFINNVIN